MSDGRKDKRFIGRDEAGEIYAVWTMRQWKGQEMLDLDDPAVVAFHNRPARDPSEPKPTSPITDDPRLTEDPRKETLR